ncbi:unnamed protein product [Brassica rapa]|uniref:BnaA02g23550D protein n=2 Tax=Brassica TaxID=3705 RepID=A0A078HWJ8_BRANA|nr:unnamed protein product [Brassica rapa]CDY41133.1 BnaA02g23550D [Brassica napus]VDC90164.1 unnamed protein product [Brassica rapa]
MLFFFTFSLLLDIFFSSFRSFGKVKEETSKKKRRLLEKKKKCRRRLVFAVVTSIELVVVAGLRLYHSRHHHRLSPHWSPLSLSISLALSLRFEFVLVTGRWTRRSSLVVEEVTKPLCDLKTSELSW